MKQMIITANISLLIIDTDKFLLNETMSVYLDACNFVSDYVFKTHD